jgi:ComF family protein
MLRRMMRGFAEIVLPKTCLSCGERLTPAAAQDAVCPACLEKIERNLPPFCHCCGRRLKKGQLAKNICPACVRQKLHFDRAFSPYSYTGIIRELIQQFKYKNKARLGSFLGKQMCAFIKEYHLPIGFMDYICPVPLSDSRLREREFNQARELGNCIAREFSKPLRDDLIIRRRNTAAQALLPPEERFANVKGSFAVADAAAANEKNILLIDDVLTTGATCSEAASALKQAGANIVFVLTLAN